MAIATASSSVSGRRARVMVVDDSAVVRGLLGRWIEAEPDLELVGSAADGAKAVAKISALDPDVVVLDIEMPVMGGLEALPLLLAARPGVRVLMASTLSRKGAAVTLSALERGAADYIAKPDAGLGAAEAYRAELMAKLQALAPRVLARPLPGVADAAAPARQALRPRPQGFQPEILAVGASTGGPQALREFLACLGGVWTGPIVVVQHMPPMFTTLLAEQLGRASPIPAVEAEDGMPLLPGRVHLARGDFHMRVRRDGAGFSLMLDQEAPENYCRPAVDPLFRSVASAFGPAALAVVLTGMGHDGREGARAIVEAGGAVLAQDEASSVVWGMPGAVVEAGLAGLVRPVTGLAEAVRSFSKDERA